MIHPSTVNLELPLETKADLWDYSGGSILPHFKGVQFQPTQA